MAPREVVILSGKGGTGKTSLTASLIPYLPQLVIADCDVDAPDLNILLSPQKGSAEAFFGANKAVLNKAECTLCGLCFERCRFGAVDLSVPEINHRCEGCGVCQWSCPTGAVTLKAREVGYLFESLCDYGPMIHGRLHPGEETSGKLVAEVRKKAVKKAEEKGIPLVLIDGSPGIGCNVISSLSGAKLVVLVTEPSLSGWQDLKRIEELISSLSIPCALVLNRWNLSEDLSGNIEDWCKEKNIPLVMKIPFSHAMVQSLSKKEIPSIFLKKDFEEWGLSQLVEIVKGK